jgi:hypothetical protein
MSTSVAPRPTELLVSGGRPTGFDLLYGIIGIGIVIIARPDTITV